MNARGRFADKCFGFSYSQRVYYIYKRNGWPYAEFDVERCRVELLEEVVQRDEKKASTRASGTKPAGAKEAWCEERRQLMKKKWKAEGKSWDEEKEKTQTAEEWWAEFQQEKRKLERLWVSSSN